MQTVEPVSSLCPVVALYTRECIPENGCFYVYLRQCIPWPLLVSMRVCNSTSHMHIFTGSSMDQHFG